MKKTKLTRSLLAACSIVALSAVMYGCTSDGSKDELVATQEALEKAQAEIMGLEGERDTAQEERDTAQEERDTANADLDTANADVMRLEGERDTAQEERDTAQEERDTANADLDTANADVMRLEGELTTAEGEVTRLKGELTMSQGEASGLQTQLTMAQGEVTRLMGELTTAEGERDTANTAAAAAVERAEMAEARLVEAEEEAADALTAARQADRIARADKILDAIGATGTPVTVGYIARTTPGGTSAVDSVGAERDGAGNVTVDVNGEDDDEYDGGETTADASGWTGVTLTRTNDNDTADMVVIYTDIEAPKPKDLGSELTTGSITINSPEQRGRIVPTEKPSGDATLSYTAADNDAFKGTYRGIPGTFECTAGTCTVSLDTKGNAMIGAGDVLSFVPNSIGSTYPAADEAYAYFGWWLNKPDKNSDTHTVAVFSGGTTGHNAAVDNAIEGNATYSGPAAGKYATKTFVAGAQTDAAVGHFDASASLTAKFGEADVPGTISGTVSNFTLDDGSSPGWRVVLEQAAIDGVGTFSSTTEVDFGGGVTVNKTTGQDPVDHGAGVGNWQGSFFAAGTDPTTDAPGTVAGIFDAVTANASVIGGFGATKQ